MPTELAPQTQAPPSKPGEPARARKLLDRWAIGEAVKLVAGEDDAETTKEIRADIGAFIRELAGPNPSAIESTLAETAALCWFALRIAEVGTDAPGQTFAQAAWRQRRLDYCHRRYLRTLKTLATVRKLGGPTLQINLARRQVNVASSPC